MIDRSLTAKRPGKEAWEKQTNRADIIPIDYPPRAPPIKIKRKTPRKKAPPKPPTAHQKRVRVLRRRLKAIGLEMSGKYGTVIPTLKIATGGTMDVRTHYKGREFGRSRITGDIVRLPESQGKYSIQVGFPVGGSIAEAESKYRHEFGHHIDVSELVRIHGEERFMEFLKKSEFGGKETPWVRREAFKTERRAWRYAREFEEDVSPAVAWSRRFALQTYRRGTSVDIDAVGGRTLNRFTFGELRPGITIGDVGMDPDIPLLPKKGKRVSVTSPDGSYRWEIKPRKPVRII